MFIADNGDTRILCINLAIHKDDFVEDVETFRVVMRTSDASVLILQPNLTVYITDNSSK